jgi:formylglycine-generating enzyme required for sulfatase activity
MTAISAALFTQSNLQLRIWFNDGAHGFAALNPVQNLTPTPYASYSANAGSALTATTAASANSVSAANIVGIIPATQLPANVITNGASGVNITGTFNGSGSGLTNVTAATLAIPSGMALIPAGSFTMGDNLDGLSDAVPISVTVSAFYLDVNLVSYSQWLSVYYWATNHGFGFLNAGAGKAANHPVQTVDWYDTVKWCNARSQQAGLTPVYYTDAGLTQVYTNGQPTNVFANWADKGYRLPTEAEWEKAARGGLNGQRFPWGNAITENLANYNGATASYSYDLGPSGYNTAFTNGVTPYTSPVGYFAPNGYGLYDMAGNVFEWCWDWYGTPYAGGSDPRGPASGSIRVLRGGSWGSVAAYTRCASRDGSSPSGASGSVGFRCVRGL